MGFPQIRTLFPTDSLTTLLNSYEGTSATTPMVVVVSTDALADIFVVPELLEPEPPRLYNHDFLEYRWHSTKTPREISVVEQASIMQRLDAAAQAALANARSARSAPPTRYRPVDRIPRWMGHVRARHIKRGHQRVQRI